MKQVMFIKFVPIHTSTPAIQENREIFRFPWQNYGVSYKKRGLTNNSPLFYIKIKKVSLFSCRAAFGVRICTEFTRIACLIQKLSRFEGLNLGLSEHSELSLIADRLPIVFDSKNIQTSNLDNFWMRQAIHIKSVSIHTPKAILQENGDTFLISI